MNLTFLSLVTGLTLLVLVGLLRPLLRRSRAQPKESASNATSSKRRELINAAIFRDQLAELERERANGILNDADFTQAHTELQHRLLEDTALSETDCTAPPAPAKRTALSLIILLPLIAVGLYTLLGNPAALNLTANPTSDSSATKQQITVAQIEAMTAKLSEHLEQNPEDFKGWSLLARTYRAMGKMPEALHAYERASALPDSNATLLAEYADLLAEGTEGNLEGQPIALVHRALKLDPDHKLALALAGTAAYNRQDYDEAQTHWGRLVKLLPPDSADYEALSTTLQEMRDKAAAPKKSAGK